VYPSTACLAVPDAAPASCLPATVAVFACFTPPRAAETEVGWTKGKADGAREIVIDQGLCQLSARGFHGDLTWMQDGKFKFHNLGSRHMHGGTICPDGPQPNEATGLKRCSFRVGQASMAAYMFMILPTRLQKMLTKRAQETIMNHPGCTPQSCPQIREL
jgi:hypothetical protein